MERSCPLSLHLVARTGSRTRSKDSDSRDSVSADIERAKRSYYDAHPEERQASEDRATARAAAAVRPVHSRATLPRNAHRNAPQMFAVYCDQRTDDSLVIQGLTQLRRLVSARAEALLTMVH